VKQWAISVTIKQYGKISDQQRGSATDKADME
jgi:hypothetical protein